MCPYGTLLCLDFIFLLFALLTIVKIAEALDVEVFNLFKPEK